MKLLVDLAEVSREELIEIIGQLISLIEAQEARIAELAGQQKAPTEGGKERKPPSWVKANRPDRPQQERQKRAHGFARRREEPTHWEEHATPVVPAAGFPCRAGGCVGAARS